jgi:hypothetical protein
MWYCNLNATRIVTAIIRYANTSKKMFLMKEKLKFYQITSVGDGALDTNTYCFLQMGYGDRIYPKRQLTRDFVKESPHFFIRVSHVILSLKVTKTVPEGFGG